MTSLVLGMLLSVSTIVWTSEVQASDEDSSYSNYDAIVSELKASMEETAPVPRKTAGIELEWEDIALHGDLGFATSWVAVTSPNGVAGNGLMKGVQFGFGMNLFTRKVRAEGAFSNFSSESLSPNLKADLKAFELRMIYLPAIAHKMTMRFGLGLAARYLNLETNTGGPASVYQASTPSSVLLIGFERKINSTFALGPDISYRSAIVGDTYDKSSWDASFRLNATF
jgi:hypothetical protein